MKLGTIFALAFGIFLVLPDLKMPAISRFVDGSGLVIAGKVFPVLLYHHCLRGDFRLPHPDRQRHDAQDADARVVCAAGGLRGDVPGIAGGDHGADCRLHAGAGRLFRHERPEHRRRFAARAASITQRLQATGSDLVVSADAMDRLAAQVNEKTLFSRTGGAATLAAGMAHILQV